MAPTRVEGGAALPPTDPNPGFAAALAASHLALTGQAIAPWDDPCPIVAHGTEADPIFCWANPAALALWETDWQSFTRLPSRLSAEPDAAIQSDRSRHLRAAASGLVTGYEGIRISTLGRRFRIRAATLWTIAGPHGPLGQAARIGQVERLD